MGREWLGRAEEIEICAGAAKMAFVSGVEAGVGHVMMVLEE